MLEQQVTYDDRKDQLEPTRGGRWTLALAEAGGPLGGTASFVRAKGDVAGYRSIPRIGAFDPGLFVLAGRVGGGWILPYGRGAESQVPALDRLYTGGSTTVRGWGANRLGPLSGDDSCVASGTEIRPDEAEETIPVGGNLLLFGNAEVRLGWLYDVSGALFVDAGRVWATPSEFSFDGVQWSVGGGLRYKSAIGPIRADLAFRLGDPPEFAAEPRWTVHFGLSEAF
jgi:outer membrane protein assembly factor BamA